jgi:Mn2+/Fe2+ NRAMP family transporter
LSGQFFGYNKCVKVNFIPGQKKNFLKYIGPGFLVTVGFIDPGNWAANVATGSSFGYSLLWVVSLSTLMLIILQHNAAHLGIASGLCLSEAASTYFKPWLSRSLLASALIAAVATALAEILGLAIGLHMLFRLPLPAGALLGTALALFMLFSNSYRRLEKWIIAFVSLIALSFIFELLLVKVQWPVALRHDICRHFQETLRPFRPADASGGVPDRGGRSAGYFFPEKSLSGPDLESDTVELATALDHFSADIFDLFKKSHGQVCQ